MTGSEPREPHGKVCGGGEGVSIDSDESTHEQRWDESLVKEECPKRVQRTSCGDCRKQEMRQVEINPNALLEENGKKFLA